MNNDTTKTTQANNKQDGSFSMQMDNFEEWCSFLNFFDSSIHFELSFMNMATDAENFEKSVRIAPAGDEFDSVRAEYSQMLKGGIAACGENGHRPLCPSDLSEVF